METRVQIFFYTSSPSAFGREITCMLALAIDNSYLFQSVYSKASLRQILCNEQGGTTILILAALHDQELDELLELKQEVCAHIPVILILADDSEATLHKAHKFRPRYLTTIHHDFSQVLSVVEHLCRILFEGYRGYHVEKN